MEECELRDACIPEETVCDGGQLAVIPDIFAVEGDVELDKLNDAGEAE